MAIKLVGEDALLDLGGEIEEMVNNRLRSFVWPSLVQFDRDPTANPFIPSDHEDSRFSLPYGDPPVPRVNEFIDPTGIARYGRGMILVGRRTMAAIASAAFGYAGDLDEPPTEWDEESEYGGPQLNRVPLIINYGDESFTRQVLPFPPLVVEAVELKNLWLVPVVDIRYQWLQMCTEVEYEKGRTWQDLIQIFLDAIGSSASPPSIDSRFTVPDPRAFADTQVSPAVALDAISLSLGYRTMLNNSSDLVFQNFGAAKTILKTELAEPTLQIGGRSPDLPVPDTIRIGGPRAVNFVDCESWKQDYMPEDSYDQRAPTSEPFVVWTSFYENEINDAIPGQNIQERDDLVDVIGEMLFNWNAPPAFVSFPGIKTSLRETSCFDYVSYCVKRTDSVYTSAITFPPDFFPRINYSQYRNNFIHLPSGSDWIFLTLTKIPTATEEYDGIKPGNEKARVYEFDDNKNLVHAKTDADKPVDDIPLYNPSKLREISPDKIINAGTISKKPVAIVPSDFYKVHFEIVSVDEYFDYGTGPMDGGDCADQPYEDPEGVLAAITRYPCDVSEVPGQDEAGLIELQDPDGWMAGRTSDELIGAKGSASLMDAEGSGGYDSCEWCIDMINLFRDRRAQVDTLKEEKLLRFRFERFSVWDHCLLPDYTIPLTDCEEEYSGGGGI